MTADSLTEAECLAGVERVCGSDLFLSSPRASELLRCLWRLTRESGRPIRPAAVAEHVLGLRETAASATVASAVRAQAMRLRKLLADYYAGPGADDPLRIRLPRGNYRLSVDRHDAALATHPRAVDHATLAVLELADHGLAERFAHVPQALLHLLTLEFGRCPATSVIAPISRSTLASVGLDATSVSRTYAESFILDGSVSHATSGLSLVLRLLDGRTGRQVWSGAAALSPQGAHAAIPVEPIRSLVQQVGDEVGVITREILRQTAATPPDALSAHEALLCLWRYWMSAVPDDLDRAMTALASVGDRFPSIGLVEAARAAIELEAYLASPDSRARMPASIMRRLERARSLAPGVPWIEVHQAWALWAARRVTEVAELLSTLEAKPTTGIFRGVLGCIRICSRIDTRRGMALLDEAEQIAVHEFWWWPCHRAYYWFDRGELDRAATALHRVVGKRDVYSLSLRMALAAASGDLAAARAHAETLAEEVPAFATAGETILRRIFHDAYVDAIARAVEPLELGWFA